MKMRDEPFEINADCEYCHGLYREAPMMQPDSYWGKMCEWCYEDGGPHAGEDPFGRTDEDWKHHAE